MHYFGAFREGIANMEICWQDLGGTATCGKENYPKQKNGLTW
jgi:hypothetical protein